MSITVAVEGRTDSFAIQKICHEIGIEIGVVAGLRGKTHLDKKLSRYNSAACHSQQWRVLRDLNSDADCAPQLLKKILPVPASKMMIRIVVRQLGA